MLSLLVDDLNVVWNTTQTVGPTASSKPPADLKYMIRCLNAENPSVVVACGLQAIEAVRQIWNGPRLELPHPACRWVSKDLYLEGKRLYDLMTRANMSFRANLWQKKGQMFKIAILQK